ncbi:MAG TPA: ABC transporter permease subunit [Roseiarcus sp.]|nr:ABC transporter permease subunit [Roseiarcus sp.]
MTEGRETIGRDPARGAPLSPARRALRRFRGDKLAVIGTAALLAIVGLCVFGPLLSPHPYDQVYRDYVNVAPSLAAHPTTSERARILTRIAAGMGARLVQTSQSDGVVRMILAADTPIDPDFIDGISRSDAFAEPRIVAIDQDGRRLTVEAQARALIFPLGADSNGRDLLTRLLVGGRVSLLVGALASAVALVIGLAYGAIAGYCGGRVDLVMMRLVDILYALPFIFFVILLIVVFGRHFVLVFAAIGAVEWLDMARIVRGQALSLKRQDYVLAAEVLGVGPFGVLSRHIAPNLIGPVIAYLTLVAAKVILLESFLSFLGLGVQEPMTSLGALIADGARNIENAPGMLLFPAGLLAALLLALTLIGEGLSDALSPKER